MSTEYTMTIRRQKDKKTIAEVSVNQIKTLLNCGDSILDFPGSTITLTYQDFLNIQEKCWKKIGDLTEKVRALQSGVFTCKSVEVKREIEDDISWREEQIKDLKYAVEAVSEMIGVARCLCEDLVMEKVRLNDKGEPLQKGEKEGHTEWKFAYQYWATPKAKKDRQGKYDTVDYLWVRDAIFEINASW